MSGAARVQVGSQPVLDECLVEFSQRREAPPRDEVVLRGAQLGPLETETRVGVRRGQAERLAIFSNRAIVVLAQLSVAAAVERPRRRAVAEEDGAQADGDEGAHPSGGGAVFRNEVYR